MGNINCNLYLVLEESQCTFLIATLLYFDCQGTKFFTQTKMPYEDASSCDIKVKG